MPSLCCPHCLIVLPSSVDRRVASRCPQCRLVIGAGRAVAADAVEAHAGGVGAAAGAAVNAARRADAAPVERHLVHDAIRQVAEEREVSCERLRMLDYVASAEADADLPSLATVLATCGTWKSAREAAADAAPVPR